MSFTRSSSRKVRKINFILTLQRLKKIYIYIQRNWTDKLERKKGGIVNKETDFFYETEKRIRKRKIF